MADIPSVGDLLAKVNDKFKNPIWDSTRDTATKNFKKSSGYLGKGPIDCVEVFRLNGGSIENANEHKEFFRSMFEDKGYLIRTTYSCEILDVGREPIIRNQQFVFLVCTK